MPSAQAVAQAARATGTRRSCQREHGELVARAVKAFGFNSSLGAGARSGAAGVAQGDGHALRRETGAGVVAYAREFFAGLAAQGVVGCGKHFPGLGGGTLDSHLETPEIERTWQQLWHEDLAPYRALRSRIADGDGEPRGLSVDGGQSGQRRVSKFWMQTVLRKRIGYRGIVFSDDLEMGGVLKFMPIDEAAVAAVRMGADLALICHSPSRSCRRTKR